MLRAGAVRYLFLDRITAMEPPARARGLKCVSLSEDIYADHFAGSPVMPGALVIEALSQLGGALLDEAAVSDGDVGRLALLVSIDRARFRRAAVPGDQLVLAVDTVMRREEGARLSAEARVGDHLVAEAELGFVMSPDNPAELVEERARLRALWRHGRWYR